MDGFVQGVVIRDIGIRSLNKKDLNNVYNTAKGQKVRRFPVIIYIHGESYEWNSGNPYDGNVLASYGGVIFVTINYRLGILGFLKVGVTDQAPSNFGLVDQVAALLWVQENIAEFGGDPGSVTLMGHGTGAACINFLMVSPMVANGVGKMLFHRAILMSGNALADWALATHPLQTTTQVSQELNCSLIDLDEFAECLRRKRLSDLMAAAKESPQFVTRFGPTVDGRVIPNEPRKLMSEYNQSFSQYELLYGVSELESDQLFNTLALIHGMLESDRDHTLKTYLQKRFEYRPEVALAKALDFYTDVRHSSSLDHRNSVLEILSDARVVSPIVQMAEWHSAVNPKSYFYVFGHSTTSKKYLLDIRKATYGEELPYVLGMPLDGPTKVFPDPYTSDEKLFSEAVMTYWTNFAHTGNPNAPHRSTYLTLTRAEWMQYNVDWPEYEKRNQSYMWLGAPPLISNKYRFQHTNFWNIVLPDTLRDHTSSISNINPLPPMFETNYNPDTRGNNLPFTIGKINRNPFTNRKPTSPLVYGEIKTRPSEGESDKENMFGINNEVGKIITASPSQEDRTQIGIVMSTIIIVCLVLLIGNVIVCAVLYYKRTKLKMEERNLKRQYEDMQNANLDLDASGNTLREKLPLSPPPVLETNTEGCNVMKMIRQSTKSEDTYEAVKASEGSSNQRFKLTRQISSSTLDPHTKVRDWIAHEIVQRCSPRFLRRNRQYPLRRDSTDKKNIKKSTTHDAAVGNTNSSTRPVSPECKNSSVSSSQKPKKVSVGIDATNDARSSSVLKQEPIELTKSVESCSSPAPGRMRRSMTLEDFTLDEKERPPLKRQNSITDIPFLKENIPKDHIIKINHQHSRSDPVDPSTISSPPKLKTFDPNEDINVTCKDDTFGDNLMSPEEALLTIKRRNFPKVLPDFPSDAAYNNSMKRRSLPAHHLLNLSSFSGNRAATLDQSFHQKVYSRIPPAPPPRTSSTLGRKPSNGAPIMGQIPQVKLAEEPPVIPEPIVSNTLHVGPLIPHRNPVKNNTIINQPIYDNLNSPQNELPSQSTSIKNIPKTIISADRDHPVKRNEPKVIIKPNTSTLKRDQKINKVIPRVFAKDNAVDDEIYSRQSSVSSSPVPSSPVRTTTPIPIPPPMPNLVPLPEKESSESPKNSPGGSSDSSNTSSDTGTVVKRQ